MNGRYPLTAGSWIFGLVLLSGAANAWAEPAVSIHVAPVDEVFDPCAPFPIAPRCQHVVVEGNPTKDHYAYVVVSGVESIRALEFGIVYAPAVFVDEWIPCVSGPAIETNDSTSVANWPGSGSGLAKVFEETVYPSRPDELVIVGYFRIQAGSLGFLSLATHPQTGRVTYVDAEVESHVVAPIWLGRADVAGTGFGYNTCGALDDQTIGEEEVSSEPGPFGRLLEGDARHCEIRDLILSSANVIVGRVVAREEVDLPGLAPDVRSRYLLLYEFPPRWADQFRRIVVDRYEKYTLSVERSLEPLPALVTAYIHVFGRVSGTPRDTLVGSATQHFPAVGARVLAFTRNLSVIPSGSDEIVIPYSCLTLHEHERNDHAEALFWSVSESYARSGADLHGFPGAEVIEGVLSEVDKQGRDETWTILRLSGDPVQIEIGHPRLWPWPDTPCTVTPRNVAVGDTILVQLCEDTFARPCLNGWSIYRRHGGRLYHGFREIR